MRKLFFVLFLGFSTFAGGGAFAGDNSSLSANYPAISGSYNKLTIQNIQNTSTSISTLCSTTNNAGLLYYNNSTNALELCTGQTAQKVPFPEICFNRFCAGTCTFAANNANGCPYGYQQATYDSGGTKVDTFTTATTPNFTVSSTTCCSCPSLDCRTTLYSAPGNTTVLPQ
jgi:hypothetical protein